MSTLTIRCMVFRSARSASSAPGYWILTATSRPSDHTALCTWPMLADAIGRVVERGEPLAPLGAQLRVEHPVHLGGGQRRGLPLQFGQRLAVRLAVLLGDRGLHHRQRLADLHRAALELTEHGEQLLGGLVHQLGVDLVLATCRSTVCRSPSAARPAMPTGRLASFALRAAPPRLMSLTRPSSMTILNDPATIWQQRFQRRTTASRMPRPPARHDRAGVDVELQRGVERRRGSAALHRRRRRRARRAMTRSTWLSASAAVASTVARSAVPTVSRSCAATAGQAGVAVAAMQVRASQAARHARDDQRPDQTGAVAHPHRQVRHSGGVQFAHHPRIGDQVVRQHHQVGGPRRDARRGLGCCA